MVVSLIPLEQEWHEQQIHHEAAGDRRGDERPKYTRGTKCEVVSTKKPSTSARSELTKRASNLD